jgi:hypothetical protein
MVFLQADKIIENLAIKNNIQEREIKQLKRQNLKLYEKSRELKKQIRRSS